MGREGQPGGPGAARVAEPAGERRACPRASRRASIDKALAQLRDQLKGASASARDEIESNIRQLEVAAGTSSGNASQIDPAVTTRKANR